MRKIRIPMASLDETSSINSMKRVEEDRSVAIEAAIVRIMKVKILISFNAPQFSFNN
jgi:cullin 1